MTGEITVFLGFRPSLVITNTVPLPLEKQLPAIVTRSVAPLFAEAVHRIHVGESVSSLYSPAETYG